MKFIKFSILCLCFSIFSKNGNAQTCQYLAYDPFPGNTNAPLNNTSGGTGWAGAWYVQNGNSTIPGYQIAGNGSLAYLDLQSSAKQAAGGNAYLTAGRNLDVSPDGNFSNYLNANGAIGQSGTNLWASILLKKNQNNDNEVHVGWHGGGLNWCESCTTTKVAVGYFGANSNVGGQRRWTLRIGNNFYPTAQQITANQEVFAAVQFSFSGNADTVRLYLNPATIGDDLPAAPTLAIVSPINLEFRHAYFYLGDGPNFGGADEFRMAETYRCVAPDAQVLVNQPPTAAMIATPISGQKPLAVSFNGTASSDPEGPISSYVWHFADGSPDATGATANHVFSAIGQHNVSLTVEDNTGLQHTVFQPITVLDENNTFPCQTSFSLLQQASCGQNNGRLQINNRPENIQLLNAQNQPMPLTNGWQYLNLPTGVYQFSGSSANGCTDTFSLKIPVDSTTCAGWQPTDCAMKIGMNLTGLADWTAERPFRNLFKQVREETITWTADCFCWNSNVSDELVFDANGYPTSLPQTTSAGTTFIRWVMSAEGGALENGQDYVILYDGAGTIQLFGDVSNVVATAGRIQFHVNGSGNIFMNLIASTAGNYIKNIRMLRLADEAINLNTYPFHDEFLNKLKPFSCLRMMDWGVTNGSPHILWANRAKTTDRTFGTERGVPYEMMIKLANKIDKDIWVCVPHEADDNFIQQMALLFKNQLEPGRKIYLEYSNEVWNWLFEQAHFNDQNRPENLGYGRAYAEKAKHVFQIWYTVFGGEAPARIQRVLGMQLTYNYLNEQILSQIDPADWDCASPTFYFGLDRSPSGNPVLNASSTAEDVLENSKNAWLGVLPNWRADYGQVKLFGKKIVGYEGGQHFTDFQTHPYQQAMYESYRHPKMYELYSRVLDTARTLGNSMACAFSNVSGQNDIYVFGHLGDIEILPPFYGSAIRYETLLDKIKDCASGNCVKPAGTKEIFQSPTSVLLRWDDSGASEYQIQWKVEGGAFQIITTNKNSHILTGLIPGKTYQWHVRAHCTNWTAYSAYRYFFTPVSGNCTRPTQLFTSRITASTAILTWEPQPGVVIYEVSFRKKTTTVWTVLTTTNTILALSNLMGGTNYEWRLRVQCAAGWTPFNTPNVVFKTKAIAKFQDLERENDALEIFENENLLVFPNPTAGEFAVDLETDVPGTCRLSVSDLAGREVFSKKEILETGSNLLKINLSDFPTGTFVLKIEMPGGGILTEKVVVVRD